MTETGTLPIGFEFGGQTHTEFEVRPQLVRDSIEAAEHPRAQKNDAFYGLCLVTKQLVRLGEIPKEKITPELLLEMHATDLAAITDATRRLEKSLRSFRGPDPTAAATDPGHA